MVTLKDYTNLVPSENATAPNFLAVLAASLQPSVDITNFTLSIPALRDLDGAQWGQLDDIGQWVGLSRNLRALAPGVFVPAPPSGIVPLPDSDYRILLRGKVGSNHWLGTVQSAFDKLTNIFGSTGSTLFMVDHQDMSITIAVAGNVPSATFQAALSGGYMQVRPGAVLADYKFPTEPGGPLFGFGVDNTFIGGFGHGVWAASA